MQQLPKNTLLQRGKYKIEKALGQGGFGITYLATQELLDRKVCIKEFFFKDSYGRTSTGKVTLGTVGNMDLVDRFLDKFIKEARTISKLEHPNIIKILDIFMENGTAYYVMDFIEGESLEEIVKRRGALPEHEAVSYIKQVANALAYLHQHKINHLDVKPANIMVRKEDNKAILIDFGVSKQYDDQGEQTSTTPVGISYGYAPLEQYQPGGVCEFSPLTDVYSLGATLHRLVTGNVPPAPYKILDGGIEISTNISPSIITAIRQSMEQNRNKRPKNIQEFISLLQVQVKNPTDNNCIHKNSRLNSEQTKVLTSSNTKNQQSEEGLQKYADSIINNYVNIANRKYDIYLWTGIIFTFIITIIGATLLKMIETDLGIFPVLVICLMMAGSFLFPRYLRKSYIKKECDRWINLHRDDPTCKYINEENIKKISNNNTPMIYN